MLNRIPDFVVGVVFGSFAFLIFLMSACCWIGVIFSEYRCFFFHLVLKPLHLLLRNNIIHFRFREEAVWRKVSVSSLFNSENAEKYSNYNVNASYVKGTVLLPPESGFSLFLLGCYPP